MDAFMTWLVSVMLVWVPVQAGQSPEATHTRYEGYAKDVVSVVFDVSEAPLFKGIDGRARTATALLAIASLEGYYREDVDDGTKRGDGGSSWCQMQVNTGHQRIVMRGDVYGYAPIGSSIGWSGRDLVDDRKKCFRAALHIARESFRICNNLSIYATGKCYRGGEPAGNLRIDRAKAAFRGQVWRDSEFGQ